MICQLIDFYEISGGYEDFYEKELRFRTPEQIAALFEETFGMPHYLTLPIFRS